MRSVEPRNRTTRQSWENIFIDAPTLLGGTMRETRRTYDEVADEYASRHVDRTGIMDQFDHFCGLVDHASANESAPVVLDVGCGPGWETAELTRRGYRAFGIDVSRALLRHAQAHITQAHSGQASEDAGFASADVGAMDMRQLGLPDDSARGVWACASVHHVPRSDIDRVLAEFARILIPGGILAISVKRGDGTKTGDAYPADDRHFTCYQPDGLTEHLQTAGFVDIDLDASEDWVWGYARASD